MQYSYQVQGMTCAACAAKVGELLRADPKVKTVEVTFDPPEARIETSEPVELETINLTLARTSPYRMSGEKVRPSPVSERDPSIKAFFPLLLIVAYLLGGVSLREVILWRFDAHALMSNFMGGFFIIFSFFKLLDLRGFAVGFSSYDLIAQRWPSYAYAYPFIEIALGLLYFSGIAFVVTNLLTFVLMIAGSSGVLKSMLSKREFQCACLGTIFKMPLSKITLFEDLLMAAMALMMLLR